MKVMQKEEIQNLYELGLKIHEIARMHNTGFYKVQKFMLENNIKINPGRFQEKYKKTNFYGNDIEKAYMAGFRIGDLGVTQKGNIIRVKCNTTRNEQLDILKNLFLKYGRCWIWKNSNPKYPFYYFEALLNKSFSFLLSKEIPNFVRYATNDETPFSFLAGYFDAEGCIYTNICRRELVSNKKKYSYFRFKIESTDYDMLKFLEGFLLSLGFHPKFLRTQKVKKQQFSLYLNREKEVRKLCDCLLEYSKYPTKINKIRGDTIESFKET